MAARQAQGEKRLTPERWETIKEIFDEAIRFPPYGRAPILESRCGSDQELRDEVERLLEEHAAAADSFLYTGDHHPAGNAPDLPQLEGVVLEGRYAIEQLLGKGGFGAVYLARDIALHSRPVVVKFLRSDAGDARAAAKFRGEMEALAQIRHPGVVSLLGMGEHDGRPYLVMEYIEGVTLRSRLAGQRLPDGVLKSIVRQIASAIDAAHAAGIVHRDLKPENIMLARRNDGAEIVKVIDFGVSRVLRPQGSLRISTVLVGTIGYIAPEQILGKATAASDIYSLAVIAWEMLTGRHPVQDEGGAADAPSKAIKLLRAAMAIDPDRRPSSALDFAEALERALEHPRGSRKRFVLGAAILGIVGAAALLALNPWKEPAATSPAASAVRIADGGLNLDPAISPAGDRIAFASDRGNNGRLDIWVQRLAGGAPYRLTEDPVGAGEPSFSPDGMSIAYRSETDGGGIYVIPASGGTPRKLADEGRQPRYSPDGRSIAYFVGEVWSGNSRVFVIPSAGGPARWLQQDCGPSALAPLWAPDGKHLLVWCYGDGGGARNRSDWWLLPVEGGEALPARALTVFRNQGLVPIFAHAPFLPADWNGARVIFPARMGDTVGLWEFALSSQAQRTGGYPRLYSRAPPGTFQAAFTSTRAAFATLNERVDLWSLPVNAETGRPSGELRRETREGAHNWWPSVSADGSRIAFISDRSGKRSLWLKDLRAGSETVQAGGRGVDLAPRMSADGTNVAYTVTQAETRTVEVVDTRSGSVSTVCQHCGYPWTWDSDSRRLVLDEGYDNPAYNPSRAALVWVDFRSKAKAVVTTGRYLIESRVRPGGRWLAFHLLNSANTRQIFVARVLKDSAGNPETSPETDWIPITDGAGLDRNPAWSPEGNLLYYQSENDGWRCIWARRIDQATGRPNGPAFAVFHSHNARLSLKNAGHESATGLAVARDKLVFSRGERTGSIWVSPAQ